MLGLQEEADAGEGRHVFPLPDGAAFAALPPAYLTEPSDTVVGFVVDDLDAALDECRAQGVELSGPLLGEPPRRYQHLRLADGRFVALVERP